MASANFTAADRPSDWERPAPGAGIAPHQARVDAIQAEARAAAAAAPRKLHFKPPPPPPPPLEPSRSLVECRLAEELDYARRLLEAVGDHLTSDPVLVHRHHRILQNFDLVGQLLGHVARVVGSDDKGEAIERIGMQELKARLKRPSGSLLG